VGQSHQFCHVCDWSAYPSIAADPDRYAPQYGGYCAGSMAMGELSVANPTAWTIVNGKLYMFAGTRFSGPFTTGEIAAADANWRSRTQH
jgi:hypothetical protein